MILNKEQFDVIAKQAKEQGIESQKLLRSLYKAGYELQGVDTTRAKVELGLIDSVIADAEKNKVVNDLKTGNIFSLDRLKDIPSDVRQTVGNIRDTYREGGERIGEAQRRSIEGEQGVGSGAFQTIGEGLRTGANILGETVMGVGRLILSPREEEAIKQGFERAVGGVVNNEQVKNAIESYQSWKEQNPERAANLEATGGIASAILEVVGAGPAQRGIREGAIRVGDFVDEAGEATRRALRDVEVSKVTNKIEDVAPRVLTFKDLEEALKSTETGRTIENTGTLRKTISGENELLTVAEKRRLLQIDPEVGQRYIDILKKADADDTLPSVFDQAVDDTLKAVKKYNQNVSNIGTEIGQIKEKLRTKAADRSAINDIIENVKETLGKKGLNFEDGEFHIIKGKNTPFTANDVNAINREIVETIENISKSQSMDDLLLGMERLDNVINYNTTGELTTSLQGVSKKVRSKLKEIRDKALTPEEASRFESYSNAQSFIDEFMSGNAENRIGVLISRLNAKNSRKSLQFVDEIKNSTGIDIADYARLAQILAETTGSTSRQRSLLRQYMGEAAGDVLRMSPAGIGKGVLNAIGKSIFNTNKLDEIQKAINAAIYKKQLMLQ